ncbi:FAD:protein FMN transferase [Limimaricola pyoseonensis]|uniref:FAD:protein FMN transferase n=1 Tax=Limimaricola pyoseonensis TaxID=521013 RepID=A0A1G7JLQ3_9RHOB|nr:FAD:protein FMN transferase [Limimaricola pyoseonensis]SDF25888.1 thiamine biosynthesis lipoprotein [Limimaricola pyoseonensis]
MQMTRRSMLAGAAMTFLAGPAFARDARVIGGRAFGSYWRCVLPGGADAGRAARGLRREFDRIDRALSPWRADSAASLLNTAPGGRWIETPPLLDTALREAEAAHDASGGGFDARLGPAVRRFGFGPIMGRVETGWFELRGDAARKSFGLLTFDACGLGKGLALDLAIAALRREGCGQALLEIGGEVRAIGRHPSGRPWQIAVERPGGGVQRLLQTGDLALATSGHAPNGVAELRLGHVIDPRSGRPAEPRLAQVSVLAETGARADALATGLLALGPVAGPCQARKTGISALFLLRREDGFREIVTGGFDAMPADREGLRWRSSL